VGNTRSTAKSSMVRTVLCTVAVIRTPFFGGQNAPLAGSASLSVAIDCCQLPRGKHSTDQPFVSVVGLALVDNGLDKCPLDGEDIKLQGLGSCNVKTKQDVRRVNSLVCLAPDNTESVRFALRELSDKLK
jgi:hypothetical protein